MVTTEQVLEEIENETQLCWEICEEQGQIFENVSHMAWFRIAVREALEEEEENN